GPGPDDYVVAQGRVALLAFQARPAEGHALQQGDVRADLGGLADDDTHAVIDEETRAELRGRMDLDARDEPRHVREEAGRDRPAVPPHRVSEPMERQRVHPGIAEQDLEGGTSSRVALTDGPNIAAQVGEHHSVPPGLVAGGRGAQGARRDVRGVLAIVREAVEGALDLARLQAGELVAEPAAREPSRRPRRPDPGGAPARPGR